MTTNNNTTGANVNNIREDGCVVLKVNVFRTKADAADSVVKMISEKAESICDDNAITEVKQHEITEKKPDFADGFDGAVRFMKNVSGEDFVELVRYAKTHHNKFIGCVKELRGALNADDAYCSALIELSRPLGEQIEDKVFSLLDRAVEDEDSLEGSLEDFVKFFEALKVINSYR